jgi:hypothetical protein
MKREWAKGLRYRNSTARNRALVPSQEPGESRAGVASALT